jgi:hypothetical protein
MLRLTIEENVTFPGRLEYALPRPQTISSDRGTKSSGSVAALDLKSTCCLEKLLLMFLMFVLIMELYGCLKLFATLVVLFLFDIFCFK